MRLHPYLKPALILLVICLLLSACAQPAVTPTNPAKVILPGDVNSILDTTQSQVTKIRGLTAPTDLPRTFLTPDEIRQKVVKDFFANYTAEDAAKDSKSLWLLGLLPKDFNLLDFYRELYVEQIGGYYDDETKSMYVVQSGAFSILEQTTYAHEFTHAIQDHNFDFKEKLHFSDQDCKEASERCSALQALIEGDASYTEALWFSQYATDKDFTDLQSAALTMKLPIYDSAPAYIREDLTFPYLRGQQFVTQLIAQGGYAAVNKAFSTLQPVSTEQIMHPSRFPDDKPVKVDLPDLATQLGSSWKVVETDNFGEWFTWLLLARGNDTNTRLNDVVASAAAEGWGGDRFVILKNDSTNEFATAFYYIWDKPKDEQEAVEAFTSWLSERFGQQATNGLYVSNGIAATLQISKSAGFYLILSESENTTASIVKLLP